MGLGDLVSRVLVEMKADTSDLKGKLRELQGVEKERAAQQIKDIENTNKGHDGFIAKLGHVGLALDTVAKFTDFARAALKSYGEHLRLSTATAGININRLSAAFGGLVNQHDLLTMAAQTQNGVLRLNQGEMETVGQAAVALKNRGFDLTDSLKKLTDAAVKGKVGGLDDLGLSIKEGASKAETLKNYMGELNKVIAESGGASANAADKVQQMARAWDDASASMKNFVAEGLLAVPDITKMLSTVMAGEKLDRSQGDVFSSFLGAAADRYQNGSYEERLARAVRAGMEKGKQNVIDSQTIEIEDGFKYDDKRKTGKARQPTMSELIGSQRRDDVVGPARFSGTFGAAADTTQRNEYGATIGEGDIIKQIEAARQLELTTAWMRESTETRERRTGYLESMFGPIEQFDVYRESFETLGSVFSAFGEAVGASYEAIVTGSGGAAKAFRTVTADGLMALGKSSAVRAISEAALGFGSLAIGSPAAIGHFKSAALHSAVAVAAGVAANQLGTSAQGAASDKAAAEKTKEEEKAKKESEKGSKGDGKGKETFIVAYLDPFANQPEHVRRQQAAEMIRNVVGGGPIENS